MNSLPSSKLPSDLSLSLAKLERTVVSCRLCPRLVRWREEVAQEKVKRFADQQYWGKPLPSFGDPDARLLVVGLAPAAHGGNRTGRMFTGDRSGIWLYRALFKAGFANQPEAAHLNDGLKLQDCYITAALRCAPPKNKPTSKELLNCKAYLLKEILLLKNVCVVVGLGRIGFDAALSAYSKLHRIEYKVKPKFSHCATYRFEDLAFIASFHPSQQNTFTGRLTEPLFDRVFTKVRKILNH